MNSAQTVLIIGGGYSGLIAAWALQRAGFDCVILEKTHRLGGVIETRETDGCKWEAAANGLLWTDEVRELFEDLKLEPHPLPKQSRRRFIETQDGRLKRWPLSWVESVVFAFRLVLFVGNFLWAKKMAKKVTEGQNSEMSRIAPQSQESVVEFVRRQFGKGPAERLARVATHGIYGVAGDLLSAQLVLGKFFSPRGQSRISASKKTLLPKYKGTVAPKGGMSELIQALQTQLEQRGVHVHLNASDSEVRQRLRSQVENGGSVVLTTGPRSAENLLRDLSPNDPRIEALKRIQFAPLILVHRLCRSLWPEALRGFGALFYPRQKGAHRNDSNDLEVLGVLQNSVLFPNRVSQTGFFSESWILRGDEGADLTVQTKISEHLERLKIQTDPIGSFASCVRWPETLPIYNHELNRVQAVLWNAESQPEVYLFGNYMGEVGLSGILKQTTRLVSQLKTSKTSDHVKPAARN